MKTADTIWMIRNHTLCKDADVIVEGKRILLFEASSIPTPLRELKPMSPVNYVTLMMSSNKIYDLRDINWWDYVINVSWLDKLLLRRRKRIR